MSEPRNPLPSPFAYEKVAEKYVFVPDCDDDRVNHRTGEPVNPRHLAAQAEVYGSGVAWDGPVRRKVVQPGDYLWGWHPAMDVKIAPDGTRSELPYDEARANEALPKPRYYRGGVWATWTRRADGTHRIVVWGGDDRYVERGNLTEKKARTLWSRINDFVTLRTLHRLGFRYT